MTPDKLNYLLILAEEQNITRAAKRLFITQPTLTAFLNRLENELGVLLFDRKHTPVHLTRSGQLYIESMKRIVLAEQQLKEELRTHENPQDKVIIGIGHIHSEMWCPRLIRLFLERHPAVNIQIQEGQEAHLMQKLKNEEIDLFMGHIVIDTVNFHFEELCRENMILMVPRHFLELTADELQGNSPQNPYMLDPAVIQEFPVIAPAMSQGLYLNFQQLINQYHIHPKRIISTSNMVTAVNFLADGLGYLYNSEILLENIDPDKRGQIIFCTLPRLSNFRKYYAGYSDDNPNRPYLIELIDIMKENIL